MGRKHVDTLQMGPPSTKERVGNVGKVRSNQEEIESNIDTGGKIQIHRGDIMIQDKIQRGDKGK